MKRVRHILIIAIFWLVGCALFVPGESVQAATKKIKKITITNVTNGKRTMVKGKTLSLKATISPSNATYKTLRWTSSKPSVVYVNSKGKLTAKKNGTAVITATARDGSGKKASVKITVGTQVSKVNINTAAGKKLYIGKTLKLSTKVLPAKASNKDLIYTSSDKKIATVSSSGVVKAVGLPSGKKSATVTITAKAADGSGKYAKYKVTVLRPVTTIKVPAVKIVALPGTTVNAGCSASPSNAYITKLTYKTSNPNIATIDGNGKITTHKVGSTNITVSSTDGNAVKKNLTVNVVESITNIAVPTTVQKLVVGETYAIDPVVTPDEVKQLGVTYTSSDTSILTVSSTGKVTAKKAGNANVYVKANDSVGTTATVKFNVKNYADITYKQSQFVAHMGNIYKAPSNSLPAYSIAGESGKYFGIECDVRETKDGEFVLIHDADISSRTNGKGSVSSLTLEQILEADMIKGTNISKYPHLKIPTLKEYLYVCKITGMTPVLHIKSVTKFSKLVEELKEVGLERKAIITGGYNYMMKFKAIDPKLNLYWLCYLTDSNIEKAAAAGIDMNVDYSQYVTQTRIENAHAKGIKVGAWTVNNMNTVKKLINKGIDFVTTDLDDSIKF